MNGRGAEERQPEGVGPGGRGPGDDAVELAGEGGHAEVGQLVDGRRGAVGVGGGVPHDQFQRPAADPAGVRDVAGGQFDAGEQVAAGLDPAGPGQRGEDADPDGRASVRSARGGRGGVSMRRGPPCNCLGVIRAGEAIRDSTCRLRRSCSVGVEWASPISGVGLLLD